MLTSGKLAAVRVKVVGCWCGFFHDDFLHGFTTTEPTFLKTKPCFWYCQAAFWCGFSKNSWRGLFC
jgi:hypothetical protein